MKKLLLLSALLIFACSSDDSNDNNTETFLERYADIVWETTETGEVIFSFNTNGLIRNGTDNGCAEYIWNVYNSNTGEKWNLLENNYDSAVLNLEVDGEIEFTATYTVSSDGNTISEFISDEGTNTAQRTNLTHPCN
jgi:hypothetical protein